jgi:outer membrane protein assembly factor BamB
MKDHRAGPKPEKRFRSFLETIRAGFQAAKTGPLSKMTAVVLAGMLLVQMPGPGSQYPLAQGLRAATTAVQGSDADWPMYMHDAAHTGRTAAAVSTQGPLFLQWAYAFGERVEVEAQPVMAGGVIYQGVMNGEMHAIDALTGKKIWIASPGGPIAHTAAVAQEKVFFGSLDGSVYAVHAQDGSTAWSFRTGGPVVSAPAVVGDLLYIGSNDGALYALKANTGEQVWKVGTDGPVVSSPAVSNGRVFFGSEDMKARAVDGQTGKVLWEKQLYGEGMRNSTPVVSGDGKTVIFVTVKPGATSYIPAEGYPDTTLEADPVATWNSYYQAHPKYRPLYYLNAESGADLWNPASRSYVPLPIPYWGLLQPVIGPDGSAWFPAPSGAKGFDYNLDHDNRLFKVNLATGKTTAAAGGPGQPEFQTRSDETGRMSFAGTDYVYTSSEDLSVYHAGVGATVLFGDGQAPFYNIGSHMNPLGPLPDRHLWRYGGATAMGGVPGGSVPIAGNGMFYYSAYSWLYAVGPQNWGLDPATSFPKRDARAYELTYPRTGSPTAAMIQQELTRRVEDVIARGPENPPMAVRWEQPGGAMQNYEFNYEVYGMDYQWVRALTEAYPFLPKEQQSRLKQYLSAFVKRTLLNPAVYAYQTNCIFYGEEGIQSGDSCTQDDLLSVQWNGDNPNLTGQRLYALWAYASTTGDWESIQSAWEPLILEEFKEFPENYDAKLGFIRFEKWRTKRLDMSAQIEAAQAVRDMAIKVGDPQTKITAQRLLENLLDGRVNLANFVPHLYDLGELSPAPIRLNPNGTLLYSDIMVDGPYNGALIPYQAELRDRNTDPSQVSWWDGQDYEVDAGLGFMYFPAMAQYYPMPAELAGRLRARLLEKTDNYLKSYEVNAPWWWMTDLAHHTTGSGEHLYESPTLAWSMFQVMARVMNLPFDALAQRLPEPVSFNARYDLYRLQNLAALLETCRIEKCIP